MRFANIIFSVVRSVTSHALAPSLVDTEVVATEDRVDMVEATEGVAVVRLATLAVDTVICLVSLVLRPLSLHSLTHYRRVCPGSKVLQLW